MINPEELMIDNWIKFQDNLLKVKDISPYMICCEPYYGFDNFEHIEGIPLTPEILEKAGFEYFEYRSKWQLSGCYYQVHEFEDGYALQFGATLPTPVIKHLHQLQNLYFALTGNHLTIEL